MTKLTTEEIKTELHKLAKRRYGKAFMALTQAMSIIDKAKLQTA